MTTITYPVITEEEFVTGAQAPLGDRKILSTVVLSEEILQEANEVQYVEVPVIEEVITIVPKKSVVEVEKIVPRVEVEYVEKIVEIPQIHYIDRHVEKEHIQEVIHEVPGELEIREIPRIVIETNPQIQTIISEKVVEVPGPVIDVTKNPVEFQPVKQYHDVEVPVVVAQTIRPIVTEYDGYVDVDVVEYEPEITPVDVYVATPIASKLVTVGAEQDVHNCVSIPPAQYNTILKSLNQHIPDDQINQIPFIKTNGKVGFLATDEAPGYYPLDSVQVPKANENDKFYDNQPDFNSRNMGQESYRDTSNFHKPGMETIEFPSRQSQVLERESSFMTRKVAPHSEKKKKLCGC